MAVVDDDNNYPETFCVFGLKWRKAKQLSRDHPEALMNKHNNMLEKKKKYGASVIIYCSWQTSGGGHHLHVYYQNKQPPFVLLVSPLTSHFLFLSLPHLLLCPPLKR